MGQHLKAMINFKELRWGNIISSPIKPEGWPIYSTDFEFIFDNPENYDPIPLTTEWLKKFGFKENVSWYLENETPYNFVYVTSGKMYYNGLHIDCQYVHQLQNLYFALTGEELILTP